MLLHLARAELISVTLELVGKSGDKGARLSERVMLTVVVVRSSSVIIVELTRAYRGATGSLHHRGSDLCLGLDALHLVLSALTKHVHSIGSVLVGAGSLEHMQQLAIQIQAASRRHGLVALELG